MEFAKSGDQDVGEEGLVGRVGHGREGEGGGVEGVRVGGAAEGAEEGVVAGVVGVEGGGEGLFHAGEDLFWGRHFGCCRLDW